jgi:hypothetical protein
MTDRRSDRRRATRQKSFLRGCLHFNNRRSSLDCLIRDISASGARLIFSDTVTIPDVVDLYIPQKEQTLRSQVHWRHGDEIGVAFVHGAQSSGVPQDAQAAQERDRRRRRRSGVIPCHARPPLGRAAKTC